MDSAVVTKRTHPKQYKTGTRAEERRTEETEQNNRGYTVT